MNRRLVRRGADPAREVDEESQTALRRGVARGAAGFLSGEDSSPSLLRRRRAVQGINPRRPAVRRPDRRGDQARVL